MLRAVRLGMNRLRRGKVIENEKLFLLPLEYTPGSRVPHYGAVSRFRFLGRAIPFTLVARSPLF